MMIFITTGTQEPFDRLLKAVVTIANRHPEVKFIVQVTETFVEVPNANIELKGFLSPTTFDHYFDSADLIIGHAGMGTIITALVKEKPLVVLPRDAKLGEHRNDHQMATAKKMSALNYVKAVYSAEALTELIDLVINDNISLKSKKITSYASEALIGELKQLFSGL